MGCGQDNGRRPTHRFSIVKAELDWLMFTRIPEDRNIMEMVLESRNQPTVELQLARMMELVREQDEIRLRTQEERFREWSQGLSPERLAEAEIIFDRMRQRMLALIRERDARMMEI